MGNLLYFIAVILIIGWAVGFIGFHAGGLIHVLLVIAVVAILL
ncbi:MAG: lmo0937 family membrane protein, partial [Saprospiraceae bacterium]